MSAATPPDDGSPAAAPAGPAAGSGDAAGATERRAVAARYARRAADPALAARYDPLRPEVLQASQALERAVAAELRGWGRPLAGLDALELGCGHGDRLLMLLRLGLQPQRLQGNDLLPERLRQAGLRLPAALRLWPGDAALLPLPPASLDLVAQFTVFSSVLDAGVQQQLAAAMWRWLRPGGAVLWYDLAMDNPRNPDVRGVPAARLAALFPHGRIRQRRLTLAPPLARAAVRLHPGLPGVLDALPLLRSHRLAWIDKPAEGVTPHPALGARAHPETPVP